MIGSQQQHRTCLGELANSLDKIGWTLIGPHNVPGTSMVSLSSSIPNVHLDGPDFSPESFRRKREPHGRRGGEVSGS